MEENVQLRTFTIANLREWLLHGHPVEGLSSAVITPTRAYAILNNPFVTDEMPVVCCLYVNGDVAAFTAAFPDILQKPEGRLAWWFSTLWCNPCYEGRGYGLIVVGTLAESLGEGNCFDAEGAHETVEIFKMLGMKTVYFPRYIHSGKQINLNSFKGRIARVLELFQHCTHYFSEKRNRSKLAKTDYTIKYQRFVDDESYDFIRNHSQSDILLRSKKALDWILKYPFMLETQDVRKVEKENAFPSFTGVYRPSFVNIYSDSVLVGVAYWVHKEKIFSVKYLYYDRHFSEIVFSAVMEHCVMSGATTFETGDQDLSVFVHSLGLFTKNRIHNISLSFPREALTVTDGTLQAGEGDMFV